MTGRPKVSVSILTYNQEHIIGQAIDSALAQRTDFDVEIRIGDDFSSDGTRAVIEAYRRRHPDRIFLNLQPSRPNGIVGRVNNMTNLASCRGEYIALLDGDDYWTDPDKLQRQIDLLDARPELGGAAHDAVVIDETGRTITDTNLRRKTRYPAVLTPGDLYGRVLFPTSSFVFRANLIRPFPDWFSKIPAGDGGLFAIAADAGGIALDRTVRSAYRQAAGTVTGMLRRGTIFERARWSRRSLEILADAYPIIRHSPGFEKMHTKLEFINHIERRRYLSSMDMGTRLFLKDPMIVLRYLARSLKSHP